MYILRTERRLLLCIAVLGLANGLAQAQFDVKTRKLPPQTVEPSAQSKSAPNAKANPLTKKTPATLPVQKAADPSRPVAAIKAQKSSVKITAFKAWYTEANPGSAAAPQFRQPAILVQGTFTHQSTVAGGPAQNRTWVIEGWQNGAWKPLVNLTEKPYANFGRTASGEVSIGPNQQITVKAVFPLNKMAFNWTWWPFVKTLTEINFEPRPAKFRLRISTRLSGAQVQVKPNVTRGEDDLRECRIPEFVVNYRCPNWTYSRDLDFKTMEEASSAAMIMRKLGFEIPQGTIPTWGSVMKGIVFLNTYPVPYRCANGAERTLTTAREAGVLHDWLKRLPGVEVRMSGVLGSSDDALKGTVQPAVRK